MTTDHPAPTAPSPEDDGTAAEALARAISELGVDLEPTSVEDYVALVQAAARMEETASALLRDAVSSARSAGTPWSAVGNALGMTRQAAQKRFADTSPATGELDGAADGQPEERILGPVNAFAEMKELALAGRLGWHSVAFGTLHHRVVRSDTQWEHRRITTLPGKVASLQADGWELIGTTFPFAYLKRDLGIPALPDPEG